MYFWLAVGVLCLIWTGVELGSGRAWLHREVRRDREPGFYWALVLVGLLLGLWCIVPWFLY